MFSTRFSLLVLVSSIGLWATTGRFAGSEEKPAATSTLSTHVLNTTTGISGFNAANWTLLTTNFTSSPAYGGTFSLAQASNDLVLSYAVPEPSTWALLAVSLATVMVLRRRRRTS